MSYLVRKINKAKWNQYDIQISNEVSADAITNCLKTTKNTLSVWSIPNENLNEIETAILALVANQDHLDTIDIVILEESAVINKNLDVRNTPGNTPIQSLVEKHRDLENLNYSKIGILKDLIIIKMKEKKIFRFTEGQLKIILNKAIVDGLINKSDLKESIQSKIV